MCSNYEPIKPHRRDWVNTNFGCELPPVPWREEAYPLYPGPFVYMEDGKTKCDLSIFGLTPFWADKKKRFGTSTYNARSETVATKPSFKNAWKESRFGLVLCESFYEPNWETGKAIRYRIKRADGQPLAIASIWEKYTNFETGEIVFSFAMLTVNADLDPVMKHFHKPQDEKRSVVVLTEDEYMPWLNSKAVTAVSFLDLAPKDFLISEPAPKIILPKNLDLL